MLGLTTENMDDRNLKHTFDSYKDTRQKGCSFVSVGQHLSVVTWDDIKTVLISKTKHKNDCICPKWKLKKKLKDLNQSYSFISWRIIVPFFSNFRNLDLLCARCSPPLVLTGEKEVLKQLFFYEKVLEKNLVFRQ